MDQTGELSFEKTVFQGKYLVKLMEDEDLIAEKEVEVINDTHVSLGEDKDKSFLKKYNLYTFRLPHTYNPLSLTTWRVRAKLRDC